MPGCNSVLRRAQGPGRRKKTSALLGSGTQSSTVAVPDRGWEGSEPQSPGRRSHGRGRLEAATSAKRQDFRGVSAGVARKKELLLQMSRDYFGSLASPVETAEIKKDERNMATEGPAVRRVQVAEHPRWGRGDAALWDRLGWIHVDGVRPFGPSLRRSFCPREQTESLGYYKATWLDLQEDRAANTVQPCVSCFIHADPSFTFFLQKGGTLCWALAEKPKLALNLFFVLPAS